MASVYYLFDDAIHVADDIVQKYSQRDRNLKDHHLAAILIQRAYRGYVVRKKLKGMHQAATTLEKYIRGWLVRFILPEKLQEQHDKLSLQTYHRMATKLQACWKGVLVRKEINIKQMMESKRRAEEHMLGLGGDLLYEEEEKEVQCVLKEEEEDIPDAGTWPGQEKFYRERILEILFDRHHLLSTKNIKGVLYNKSELKEIEKVLASLSWTKYMKNLKKIYKKHYMEENIPNTCYMFTHKKLRQQEDLFRLRDRRNDQKEVLIDLSDTEDRTPFKLTSKVEPPPYERKMFLEGKYAVRKSNIIRDQDKSKNVCDQEFSLSFKNIMKECKVPPYYADFWYRECTGHTFID